MHAFWSSKAKVPKPHETWMTTFIKSLFNKDKRLKVSERTANESARSVHFKAYQFKCPSKIKVVFIKFSEKPPMIIKETQTKSFILNIHLQELSDMPQYL